MRIFFVADDEVGIAAHLFREMTVQIQLDADRHAWPDDSAYAFDQITLAIVISLRNHGAMQIELHGVDRQRHLEIAEDFPPEVLIDAAQGRADRKSTRLNSSH